jgi:hypothetical protein
MVDPISILERRMVGRSLRTLATELDISAAYLSDIFLKKRPIGPKVLKALGLEKRVTYHKANGAK